MSKRKPSELASIRDVRTVVDHFRRKVCGGLVASLQIWEMAILPGLLYNSEFWIGMTKQCIADLEDLQRKSLKCF